MSSYWMICTYTAVCAVIHSDHSVLPSACLSHTCILSCSSLANKSCLIVWCYDPKTAAYILRIFRFNQTYRWSFASVVFVQYFSLMQGTFRPSSGSSLSQPTACIRNILLMVSAELNVHQFMPLGTGKLFSST